MSYTAGDFNKVGKVYRIKSTATIESDGKIDESLESNWELVSSRHFQILPSSSKSFLVGDQLNAQISHQLTTRYDKQSKAFTEKHKFIYQGRVFHFSGPGLNVEERNRFIAFPAIEQRPA